MSKSWIPFLSIFQGILMFAFGFLKFFEPFHGWFDAQVHLSHLPEASILLAKFGEMGTGCLFLLPWIWKSLPVSIREAALVLAAGSLVVQMATAIYVHLQRQVPASVLPLGIKPPFIPTFVLILALLTGLTVLKEAVKKGQSVNPVG